jgi:hypothetical protein
MSGLADQGGAVSLAAQARSIHQPHCPCERNEAMHHITRASLLCAWLWACSWPTAAQSRSFTLQVEALHSQAAALALVNQLSAAGAAAYYLQATIPGQGTLYRVRTGRFAAQAQAKAHGEMLRRAGIITDYFIARYEAPPSQPETANSSTATASRPRTVTRAAEGEQRIPAEAFREEKPRTAISWRNLPASSVSRTPQSSASAGTWEVFFAGGGLFWSRNDTTLDRLIAPFGAGLLPFRIRQSFVPGVQVTAGVVKNLNERSGFELAYSFGTNNFRISALEDGDKIGIPDIKRGDSLSLGVRSHLIGYNYRHTFRHGEASKLYLTFGGNLAVFAPKAEAGDLALIVSGGNLGDFSQVPRFETVLMPAVNFGGGATVNLSERVRLRFEVRDYLTFSKRVRATAELTTGEKIELKLFGGTQHNLVPSLGLAFVF